MQMKRAHQIEIFRNKRTTFRGIVQAGKWSRPANDPQIGRQMIAGPEMISSPERFFRSNHLVRKLPMRLHEISAISTARANASLAENGENFSRHFWSTNEIACLELKTRLFAWMEKAFPRENFWNYKPTILNG